MPNLNIDEYITFANEWDTLIDCECIPNGLYKGLPVDHDIDLSYDARAEKFVAYQQKEFDRLDALRYDVPESCLPAWASTHEDRVD